MTENLFQQIWSDLHFKTSGLQTVCGKAVSLLDRGIPNQGDGPDFTSAAIRLGPVTLYGDIELHLRSREWFDHGHHRDARYNRVILHVFLSGPPGPPAKTESGLILPALRLQPYIPSRLNDILSWTKKNCLFACEGHIHHLSNEIIQDQFEKARQQYFEYRCNQLMSYYDPLLPPSRSWRQMLCTALFEGLGFVNNRKAMIRLYRLLSGSCHEGEKADVILKKVMKLSGLFRQSDTVGHEDKSPGEVPVSAGGAGSGSCMSGSEWDFSSTRPSNQPPVRIRQAAGLYHSLGDVPFSAWLSDDPQKVWHGITAAVTPPIGYHRRALLYSTVYLPALHILGNLFHSRRLTRYAWSGWLSSPGVVPESIRKKFTCSGFPDSIFKAGMGAVYQYKHYCSQSRCESCFVMQKIMRA